MYKFLLTCINYASHVYLVPSEARRGRWHSWTGVIDGYEPSCGCWDQTYALRRTTRALNPWAISLTSLICFFDHNSNPWLRAVLNACVNQTPVPKEKNFGTKQTSFNESPVIMTLRYQVIDANKQYPDINPNAPQLL